MKIVCDACQAKYSIADEKIQGKSFKIRCKKCNHIIVVKVGPDGALASSTTSPAAGDKARATGSHTASAGGARASASHAAVAARSPVPPTAHVSEQPVWHVVVDGEQVGPLAESEIKDHLRQGKVNSDTLVWKEGFGDWTAFSAVPELTPLLARITQHPAAKPAGRDSARPSASHKVAASPAAAAAPEADDPFAAATVVTPAGTADLFASAMATPAVTASSAQSPAPTSPFLFGGGAPAQPAEQVVVRSTGGNGAGTTHLTGQRNENSVLFSLSNLEALAVPAQQSGGIRSPSASTNTEGSGLIDIRSMAAMTLSDGSPGEVHHSSDALPTFSTPQFSPVAPVLLPLSTSGPPKWVYPVLGLLGIGMLAIGFSIYKVATKPPPGLAPVPVAPPPAALPAPAQAVAPAAAPAPEAAKPTAEEKSEAAAAAAEEKPVERSRGSSGRSDRGRRRGSDQSSGKGSSDSKKGSASASAATPTSSPVPAAKPSGKKGAKSLDDLLGEVGTKKGGDDGQSKPAVKLVTLTQRDIVNAMKAVQPKVQSCANKFRVPGTAMAKLSVAAGGRISSATVTGRFAGTPTGSCVEAAAKSAKLPPCQSMNFPWPFTLSPR